MSLLLATETDQELSEKLKQLRCILIKGLACLDDNDAAAVDLALQIERLDRIILVRESQ